MTRLLVVLSCCASLWVSGCSDAPSPTSPSSPIPGSPSPAPTSEPTQARETPEEFVRRWVEVANQLGRDGDPEPLLRASHRCADCSAIANGVAQIYEDGGWIRGGDWDVLDPVRYVRAVGAKTVLRFVLRVAPSTYKVSSTSREAMGVEERVHMQATVVQTTNGPKMHEFVRLAS